MTYLFQSRFCQHFWMLMENDLVTGENVVTQKGSIKLLLWYLSIRMREWDLMDKWKSCTVTVVWFSSVQLLSRVRLCDPMKAACQASLSQLLEFTQTHVHRVGDAIQPSHPLLSPSPPAHNPSQNQGLFPISQLFTWGGQSIGVSASASVLPMNTQDWSPLR